MSGIAKQYKHIQLMLALKKRLNNYKIAIAIFSGIMYNIFVIKEENMFVQELTEEDVLLLSINILENVAKDKNKLDFYLENSEVFVGEEYASFSFHNEFFDERKIWFYDFEVKADFVHNKNDEGILNLLYGKFMYKKFGEKYIEAMRKIKNKKERIK